MSYCETTALEVDRLMLAMPPRIGGVAVLPAVIGKVSSALSESIWNCGVCITIEYDTPLSGLREEVGATCALPARLTTRLLVTSRSVSPTYCARVRSTSILNVGALGDCWMRASAMPGIFLMRFSSLLA